MEEDEPPALDEEYVASSSINVEETPCLDDKSTMEQMMEEALRAKAIKEEKRRQARQARKVFDDGGLKKGFLTKHATPERKSKKKNVHSKKNIPTIKPKDKNANNLAIPEVQAALNEFNQLNPKGDVWCLWLIKKCQ